MRAEDVKAILAYTADIPRLLHMADAELEQLDEDYNCLHGIDMDGMPHGTTPGKPTENLAEKLASDPLRAYRIAELKAKKRVWLEDAVIVRGEIARMGSVAQRILNERFIIGRSWEDTAAATGWSISTTKRKGVAALYLLGQRLDLMPGKAALLARARDARI